MVHHLFWSQFRDDWEDTASVAAEKNDVGWVSGRDAWNLGVADILNGISSSGILSQGCIVVVNNTCLWIEDNILKNGPETDGVEDFRLLLGGKINTFGVALNIG